MGNKMQAAQDKSEAIEKLSAMLKPNDTVYTVLRHVSASGMQRRIDCYIMRDNQPRYISYYVAKATGRKLSDKGGIVCNGCGMDMGFDLVYSLGYYVWPNGTPEAHGNRNGAPDYDGGYALRHEWI